MAEQNSLSIDKVMTPANPQNKNTGYRGEEDCTNSGKTVSFSKWQVRLSGTNAGNPDWTDDFEERTPFLKGDSENPVPNFQSQELDILNPETWKRPRPDLLIESELEAFNGWYGVMRKGSAKYQRAPLSHEEATHLAWEFLIDSMKNQYREGRGRYAPKN